MAGLNGELTIKTAEYRPCIVEGRKALFHRWHTISNVLSPSPMIGGHPGGQITYTRAIIEYEDGTVSQCNPTDITFCDPPHKEYCFGAEQEEPSCPPRYCGTCMWGDCKHNREEAE